MERLRVIFNHIAKTGGTSLLQHFRSHFGDEGVFVYGPQSRCTRFFDGKLQLEEYESVQSLDQYSVFQGHGVTDSLIGLVGDPHISLMVVLREPVSWTRSRWNQRNIASRSWGTSVNPERFLSELASNQAVKNLTKKFGSFADDGLQSDLDRAISILSKFDYVFTLGKIEEQMSPLAQRYNLPSTLERRRVAEEKTRLPFSDDQIREINHEDAALFELAHRVVKDSDGRHHNALGFDEVGRARVVERLLGERNATKHIAAEHMYANLADAICFRLRAPAALKLIDGAPEWVPVRDPARLRSLLEAEWSARSATLGAEHLARAEKIADRWTQKMRKNALPERS